MKLNAIAKKICSLDFKVANETIQPAKPERVVLKRRDVLHAYLTGRKPNQKTIFSKDRSPEVGGAMPLGDIRREVLEFVDKSGFVVRYMLGLWRFSETIDSANAKELADCDTLAVDSFSKGSVAYA